MEDRRKLLTTSGEPFTSSNSRLRVLADLHELHFCFTVSTIREIALLNFFDYITHHQKIWKKSTYWHVNEDWSDMKKLWHFVFGLRSITAGKNHRDQPLNDEQLTRKCCREVITTPINKLPPASPLKITMTSLQSISSSKAILHWHPSFSVQQFNIHPLDFPFI